MHDNSQPGGEGQPLGSTDAEHGERASAGERDHSGDQTGTHTDSSTSGSPHAGGQSGCTEPRFKLLNGGDLRALTRLTWCVRGVLPAVGLAAVYGPSGSGKTFLGLDMAAAIALGRTWFGHAVKPTPVVYVVLEGEAGFIQRVAAWESNNERELPDNLHVVLQPFKLTAAQDVRDLAAVVPVGAVVILDTLNRAAPTADENSSKDMGSILEGTNRLQRLTQGLVVFVHHPGKAASKGMRGHSSLFAAMDAVVEVSCKGGRREWKVAKSKDGPDGDSHSFTLKEVALGIDEDGEAMTSCVVEPEDTPAESVRGFKTASGANQKLVMEALLPMFETGEKGKTGVPPDRACIGLRAAIAAGSAKLASCPSDKRNSRAKEAIMSLVTKGVLGLHEEWLWLA